MSYRLKFLFLLLIMSLIFSTSVNVGFIQGSIIESDRHNKTTFLCNQKNAMTCNTYAIAVFPWEFGEVKCMMLAASLCESEHIHDIHNSYVCVDGARHTFSTYVCQPTSYLILDSRGTTNVYYKN